MLLAMIQVALFLIFPMKQGRLSPTQQCFNPSCCVTAASSSSSDENGWHSESKLLHLNNTYTTVDIEQGKYVRKVSATHTSWSRFLRIFHIKIIVFEQGGKRLLALYYSCSYLTHSVTAATKKFAVSDPFTLFTITVLYIAIHFCLELLDEITFNKMKLITRLYILLTIQFPRLRNKRSK